MAKGKRTAADTTREEVLASMNEMQKAAQRLDLSKFQAKAAPWQEERTCAAFI